MAAECSERCRVTSSSACILWVHSCLSLTPASLQGQLHMQACHTALSDACHA